MSVCLLIYVYDKKITNYVLICYIIHKFCFDCGADLFSIEYDSVIVGCFSNNLITCGSFDMCFCASLPGYGLYLCRGKCW